MQTNFGAGGGGRTQCHQFKKTLKNKIKKSILD